MAKTKASAGKAKALLSVGIHHWIPLVVTLVVLLLAALASGFRELPEPSRQFVLQTEGTATPSAFNFTSSVITTPLEQQASFPQEVQGHVAEVNGAPMVGIRVRVAWPGGQAFDTTKGGGVFRFTLNAGEYSLILPDFNSQPAFIIVDGKTRIEVAFKKVQVIPLPPTSTPTTLLRTATPTPSARITPTRTGTITPSPTADTPTPGASPSPTLSPTLTPRATVTATLGEPTFSDIATPIIKFPTPSIKSATPEATNTPRAFISLPKFSLDGIMLPFFIGSVIGGIVIILGVVLAILRKLIE